MYPSQYGSNPLYPRSSDFKVVHKDSTVGKGVISLIDIEADTIICALAGDIVSDIRQHTLQITPDEHLYDIYFTGYLLHSCDPNVYLDMENRLAYAIKPIKKNEYLYMDYSQTEDVLFRQFPCSCGAKGCRGWITGRKEQPNEQMTDQFVVECC